MSSSIRCSSCKIIFTSNSGFICFSVDVDSESERFCMCSAKLNSSGVVLAPSESFELQWNDVYPGSLVLDLARMLEKTDNGRPTEILMGF